MFSPFTLHTHTHTHTHSQRNQKKLVSMWGDGMLAWLWWLFHNVHVYHNIKLHNLVCCSVMSNSLRLHGLQPARLLCPWQNYWSRLPFPIPGDLTDPGIKPTYLMSPALAGRFFTLVPPGKPCTTLCKYNYLSILYFMKSEKKLYCNK